MAEGEDLATNSLGGVERDSAWFCGNGARGRFAQDFVEIRQEETDGQSDRGGYLRLDLASGRSDITNPAHP